MNNYFIDVMFGEVLDGGTIDITADLEGGRYQGPFKTEIEAWQQLLFLRTEENSTMYDAVINPLLKLYRKAVEDIDNGSTSTFTLIAAVELRKVLLAAGQHEPFPSQFKSARSK